MDRYISLEETANLSKVSCRKRNHFNVLPIVVGLLTFSTTSCYSRSISIGKLLGITVFGKPPGLYFGRGADAYIANSDWNLVAFIDLRKFSNHLDNLETQKNEIKMACGDRFQTNGSCFD